jgi:hypothetical protein
LVRENLFLAAIFLGLPLILTCRLLRAAGMTLYD